MDPLTASTTFATIVSLISIFKQEQQGEKNDDREAFLGWLSTHRHEELKEFIIRSQEIGNEIDLALQQDHEVILAKLENMDEILATLLSRVEGIGGLARALHPNTEISEQAVNILRALVSSTSSEFHKIMAMGHPASLSLVHGGSFSITEPRFLDDDLQTLLRLGLLRVRYGGNTGTEFYGITRNAVKLVEAIDGKK